MNEEAVTSSEFNAAIRSNHSGGSQQREWKYLDAWDSNPYTLNKEEYKWLVEKVTSLGIKSVLEFGPGSSTWAFLEQECSVWTLENDPEWHDLAVERSREHWDVHPLLYKVTADLVVPELRDGPFDCAIVDGPNGGDYFKRYSRLCSFELARSRTGLIFAHDANRKKEMNSILYLEDKGWRVVDKCPVSERGFLLLQKQDSWSPWRPA